MQFDQNDKELPSISIIIPTYNEERNIGVCLSKIYSQDYPLEKIEVLIIDNYSSDKTIKIAENFDTRIFFSDIKDPEVSKLIGLKKASKKLFMYIDADIELVGVDFFKNLTFPLIDDKEIVGSFPRFTFKPKSPMINRYLKYHPLELDPLLRFLSKDIEDTVIQDKKAYMLCEFDANHLPPIGICLYRREILRSCLQYRSKFMDNDIPVILSKNGLNKFAYVPDCRIYHENVDSLRVLLKKRERNVLRVFLPYQYEKEFVWVDLSRKISWVKLFMWVIYVSILLPLTLKGFCKAVRFRDICWLYEPIVGLVVTDFILYNFLRHDVGRRFIVDKLRNAFK